MPRSRPKSRQSGQVAVETAIVMPLMVFMCLGIIQLTMIEQAKIMTEYAAYNAARAGIVWNGNNERMHDAAIFSLLPTMGDTHDLPSLAWTWGKAEGWDTLLVKALLGGPGGTVPDTFTFNNVAGLVRIDTVSPSWWSGVYNLWKLPTGAGWKELDFDGPAAYPDVPGLEAKFAKFFNLNIPDDDEEQYRKATVLEIRLRYLYEMKIPFADWVIFTAWFASNAGVELYGAIDRPTQTKSNMMNSGDLGNLGTRGRGIKTQRGYDSVYPLEMGILWMISKGSIPLLGKRYYLPLTATYSMRMQSNFYRKWIMHVNPGWGL
jgi:hypothetical protein